MSQRSSTVLKNAEIKEFFQAFSTKKRSKKKSKAPRLRKAKKQADEHEDDDADKQKVPKYRPCWWRFSNGEVCGKRHAIGTHFKRNKAEVDQSTSDPSAEDPLPTKRPKETEN